MGTFRSAAGAAALGLAVTVWVSAQQQPLPGEPARQFGQSVTGAFEGWFDADGGGRLFLLGYFNRNVTQPLDIPVGPNNRIEPGGPDFGQPTHFIPGRKTGLFAVGVPKGFTPEQSLTWTIVANGQRTVIPLRLNRDYIVSPFADVAVGNTPPVVRLSEKGAGVQGPVAGLATAATMTASVSSPLTLTVWVDDDAKFSSGSNSPFRGERRAVSLDWSKYRGPGSVTFDPASPVAETLRGGAMNQPYSGKASTSVRFGAPGDYALHLAVEDFSRFGAGGEICCWTNAFVKVTVTP